MDEQPAARMNHAATIIALSILILAGFAAVTFYVMTMGDDATIKGSVIQTWNNLAIGVGAFWLGSSLGSKTKGAG